MKDPKTQKLATMLLDYLRANNRTSVPTSLIQDLRQAASAKANNMAVMVVSAVELDTADKKLIEGYASKKVTGTFKITYKVDPRLIAGFTLRIGDELIDTSVQAKLAMLKNKLVIN